MEDKEILDLLKGMGVVRVDSLERFCDQEDGTPYNVWQVDTPEGRRVLKQAKGYEHEIYKTFFSEPVPYAPRLLAAVEHRGAEYLLLEWIPGHDLMRCSREDLISVLDSLIIMQKAWWGNTSCASAGRSFERSLPGRENRLQYLRDHRLEAAYRAYLEAYRTLPRTLCHDDLLPFNVLVSEGRAVLIDWEYGGILPYPTSLARLIAHGEESGDAFFWMTGEDKRFAVDYYYEKCAKLMGISRDVYDKALDLCLFYEYCEWIYVGNRYGDRDNERFRKYEIMATELAIKMGY